METMGQAIDEAIRKHETIYPQSEVYRAEVSESDLRTAWVVLIHASHFSVPCRYYVRR
jgi:hypothetical protein